MKFFLVLLLGVSFALGKLSFNTSVFCSLRTIQVALQSASMVRSTKHQTQSRE